MKALVIAAIVLASAVAHAYPQYQLSHGQTCSECHLSPAGDNLLTENGLALAETMSQWGQNAAFLDGALPLPSWLELGGDTRWAAGYIQTYPKGQGITFPMQAELFAAASVNAFSLHVTAGAQPPVYDNIYGPTLFGSREHYVMWQQHPGEPNGLYIRAGRFMPVFGLRFAEHPAYDRLYGGTPLYAEAYGLAAEYISPKWELHATGFVHDPLQTSVELGNGGAIYGEVRVDQKTAIGLEGKLDIVTNNNRKEYFGATAKHYFEKPNLLIQGEAELVHDKITAGGVQNGAVAYGLASYFQGSFMIDLGAGYYTESLSIRYLDQEAFDLNIHWFVTSHVEVVAINRVQMLELGAGGLTAGYSLIQGHYRL